jgi:TRAP-type C4-dicarboxylate transport system permease small subunit
MYFLSASIAGSLLLILFIMVVVQMISRWMGQNIPGLTTVAGYIMGMVSFFGLAYTLKLGVHIRVTLLVQHLGHAQKIVEMLAVTIALLLALLMCYYAGKMTFVSYQLGEVSQAQDATALWIPQLGMFIGMLFFAIALIDLFFREWLPHEEDTLIHDADPRE